MRTLNRNVMVGARIFAEGTLWLGIPEEARKQIPEAYFASSGSEPEKVEEGSGPGDPVGGADETDLAASAPAAALTKPQRAKRAKSRRR
jgi:hypothetical protein